MAAQTDAASDETWLAGLAALEKERATSREGGSSNSLVEVLAHLRTDLVGTAQQHHAELRQQLEAFMEQQRAWQLRMEEGVEAGGARPGALGPSSAQPSRAPFRPHGADGAAGGNRGGALREAAAGEDSWGVRRAAPGPLGEAHTRGVQETLEKPISDDLPNSNSVSTKSGLGKQKKKKKSSILRKADGDEEHTLLQKCTQHKAWEWGSMLLIITNAVTIGWSTQVTAVCTRDSDLNTTNCELETIWTIIGFMFTILFLIDLVARMASDGILDFFQRSNADLGWNIFDTAIVGIGTLEAFLILIQAGDLGGISVIRVLRVLRIAKVVKVIRVMPFFRELRIMIDSIIGSMKSFCWSMMVMSVMFYIFGISLTAGVSAYLVDTNPPDDQVEELMGLFGDVWSSMLSLYMAMSGGNDWSVYWIVLEPVGVMYSFIFLFCISLAIFAVVNVVMAVFVESSLQTSGNDKDTLIQEALTNKEKYRLAIEEVFEEMDESGDRSISLDEFEEKVKDERVLAYFDTLKLDVTDASTLFNLLDADGSGSLGIEEFAHGCARYKGESRALELALIRKDLAAMKEVVIKLGDHRQAQEEAQT